MIKDEYERAKKELKLGSCLHLHLYGDPSHAIGLLFAKAKHFKLIQDTGKRKRSEILSNHQRENHVFRRV